VILTLFTIYKVEKGCQKARVSDPHPFHVYWSRVFNICRSGSWVWNIWGSRSGAWFFPKISFFSKKKYIKTLDQDQNANPDPGTWRNAGPEPDPDLGTPKYVSHADLNPKPWKKPTGCHQQCIGWPDFGLQFSKSAEKTHKYSHSTTR